MLLACVAEILEVAVKISWSKCSYDLSGLVWAETNQLPFLEVLSSM